ncbi:flavodoxin domain-containing protein [Thalassomonas haliotis]|uniref:Flavodoxin domain-containing protein n=1 Tax=Thalassomonas haliotis TaxID=485448 RepID=A0ABY7VEM2_9GAMM|nr:flavodoxin domain-containing protein [Thalassomonas haliotis]WDE11998.1 flavodoxin domain-containing protein [Thalassomonas haliotis]
MLKPIYIVFGSTDGGAENVAECLQAQLEIDGKEARLLDRNSWHELTTGPAVCLAVVATTGAGDFPKNILPLFKQLSMQDTMYDHLSYAVLAMGDTCFGDTFCMAGKKMDDLLANLNARPLMPLTTIDASEVQNPMELAEPWLDMVCEHIEA